MGRWEGGSDSGTCVRGMVMHDVYQREWGQPVVVVASQQPRLVPHADLVAVLHRGQLLQLGTPQQVLPPTSSTATAAAAAGAAPGSSSSSNIGGVRSGGGVAGAAPPPVVRWQDGSDDELFRQ